MSCKNRSRSTVAHDELLTKPEVARAIVGLLGIRPGQRVLEPSAGDGVFLGALADVHGPGIVVDAVELQAKFRGAIETQGQRFETPGKVTISRFEKVVERKGYDWVVGNPPYSHAETHIRHALYHLAQGGHLAFLLRLNFRATSGRRDLFRALPPRFIWVLEERPSFTRDGHTDGTEYAVFVWQRTNAPHRTTLDAFSWSESGLYEEDKRRIRRLAWGNEE